MRRCLRSGVIYDEHPAMSVDLRPCEARMKLKLTLRAASRGRIRTLPGARDGRWCTSGRCYIRLWRVSGRRRTAGGRARLATRRSRVSRRAPVIAPGTAAGQRNQRRKGAPCRQSNPRHAPAPGTTAAAVAAGTCHLGQLPPRCDSPWQVGGQEQLTRQPVKGGKLGKTGTSIAQWPSRSLRIRATSRSIISRRSAWSWRYWRMP